jgi:NAD(P)-dependent dehydrogenase (short-subunit alcohol dehydrogenase family)
VFRVGLLENQVALVTGAASGIGRATAILFATEGAELALADRNRGNLEELEQILHAQGCNVSIHSGDLSSAEVARRVTEETIAKYGKVDVLSNNAGIDLRARIEDTSEEDWDRVLAVNLKAIFLLSRCVVPHMVRARCGSIINTSSAAALHPIPERPAYIAAKGAVVALTKALALDLGPSGIRVNCICPGAVNTPLLQQDLRSSPDERAALAELTARYPLGRISEPEEIACLVLFLASSQSSYLTGATIPIDGGRTMH